MTKNILITGQKESGSGDIHATSQQRSSSAIYNMLDELDDETVTDEGQEEESKQDQQGYISLYLTGQGTWYHRPSPLVED